MMTKLVFPKSEDETEGADIGGLIYSGWAGREPAFRRWCNAQFPEFGYDPKFAEEMFREISELYTANPIPEIDITRPITAIRCLDGYISLKDGKYSHAAGGE